jgi:hypothetical protein
MSCGAVARQGGGGRQLPEKADNDEGSRGGFNGAVPAPTSSGGGWQWSRLTPAAQRRVGEGEAPVYSRGDGLWGGLTKKGEVSMATTSTPVQWQLSDRRRRT